MSVKVEEELFSDTTSGPTRGVSPKAAPAKPRLKMINRDQLLLRPTDIEELLVRDHDVRAIWELTGRLDLSGYYESIEAVEGVAGREPFDPRLLVSLWMYATKDGVSSGREISRLCEYSPAYQWLTGCSRHVKPNHRFATARRPLASAVLANTGSKRA
jgi:transposase